MNPNQFNTQSEKMIEVQCEDRWQAYCRLQELEIVCQCSYQQPLKVQVNSAVAAIQVWSVIKQLTMPRQALASWLEDCWKVCSFPEEKL